MSARLPVRKTYKLYVGGQFPRSESGRSYVARSPDGSPLANAVRSSRKDVRDAVRTARGAASGVSLDPGDQAIEVEQAIHELHLVQTYAKEELAERAKSSL